MGDHAMLQVTDERKPSQSTTDSIVPPTRLHRPPVPNYGPPIQAPTQAWRTGVKAPVVPGLDYSGSDRTLVLFLSTDCIHCQHATPFFKSLAGKLAGVSPTASRMVAVYPQSAVRIRQSEGEALPFETKSDVDLGELGVRSTPTMLLVGRNGAVIKSWLGAPKGEVEREISASLLSQNLGREIQLRTPSESSRPKVGM